jgi:hypothetical protein
LPDSKQVAARKMKNIYDLLQAAGKRPINPNRAFDLQEANPGERDPAKRFQAVPLAPGTPSGESLGDDAIEQRIRELEEKAAQ